MAEHPAPLRIGFAGTPDYAAQHLSALLEPQSPRAWTVELVLSQPDRPRGRGQGIQRSAVAELADAHGIPVWTPERLRGEADETLQAKQALVSAQLDVLVVVAYGLIIPADVLSIPRHGCLNLHASLLPRWRGAAPIQRALMAGDPTTGVCLMQMDEGLDTGPVWDARRVDISDDDNAASLHDRLSSLGAQMLVEFLAGHRQRDPAHTPQPQPSEGASYAAKILKADRQMDFQGEAADMARRIRGLDPTPAAEFPSGLKAGGARLIEAQGQWAAPGTVVRLPRSEQEPLVVACGRGLLGLGWLQRPGGRRLDAAQFCRGAGLSEGSLLL